MIILRPATAADQPCIEAVIHAAQINPLDLKWQHFTLAVDDASGETVGTVQIKTHSDGSRELASLAVIPEWRGQGLARRLIEYRLAGTFYVLAILVAGIQHHAPCLREYPIGQVS